MDFHIWSDSNSHHPIEEGKRTLSTFLLAVVVAHNIVGPMKNVSILCPWLGYSRDNKISMTNDIHPNDVRRPSYVKTYRKKTRFNEYEQIVKLFY